VTKCGSRWRKGLRLEEATFGTDRLYVTPPLVVGKPYSYEIRARWQDGGKQVERTRKVEVTGGARVRVNLLAPAGVQQGGGGKNGKGPIATYNTDVFQYWHINGEAFAKGLPPLDAKGKDAFYDYSYSLALQAAVWGIAPTTFYALRYNDALGPKPKAPPGEIWRMENISTPQLSKEAGYVTPNVNTVYGFGFMDLGPEPIILTVPNSKGRYYMVEVLDAYTNAFAYPAGATNGYGGGTFALIGPGWRGTLPAGMRRIDSPTRWVLLQPRVHMKNPEDLPGAKKVLSEITTQPLSRYLGTAAPEQVKYDYPVPHFADPKLPVSANYYKDPLQFWEILSNCINENPPPQDQITALLPMFAPLGIELGKKWDRTKVHPVTLEAMKQAAANIGMKTMVQIPPGNMRKGWVWMWPSCGNFRTDYFTRAQIVRWGLTANTLEEAVYIGALLDGENRPLVGEKKYVVRLNPPAYKKPAFWSATVYNYDNNYTVENPINRYCLGSDNKMTMNKDGTVTLYLQSTSPGTDKEANWPPTPRSGRWYINLRAYAPGVRTIQSAFNHDVYAPAPIEEVK
jgi:DNA sulfur modification protein DndE